VLALTTGAAAWSIPALLVALLLSLAIAGWPALSQHGIEFITGTVWAPVQGQYGALPALYGTVVSSLIAIALAVPVAWGVASLLTEWCPVRLARFIGSLIELLAAVPSIVYGMWGSMVLCPWLQRLFPSIFPAGSGIASAGVVLALMVTPLITAMTRDAMQQVSPLVKESCYGLGGTSWETLRLLHHADKADTLLIDHQRWGTGGDSQTISIMDSNEISDVPVEDGVAEKREGTNSVEQAGIMHYSTQASEALKAVTGHIPEAKGKSCTLQISIDDRGNLAAIDALYIGNMGALCNAAIAVLEHESWPEPHHSLPVDFVVRVEG